MIVRKPKIEPAGVRKPEIEPAGVREPKIEPAGVREPKIEPAGARCPVCGKPSEAATRPFCSIRCADVDLGRWLTGQYRIPGPSADLDEDPPSIADDGPDAA